MSLNSVKWGWIIKRVGDELRPTHVARHKELESPSLVKTLHWSITVSLLKESTSSVIPQSKPLPLQSLTGASFDRKMLLAMRPHATIWRETHPIPHLKNVFFFFLSSCTGCGSQFPPQQWHITFTTGIHSQHRNNNNKKKSFNFHLLSQKLAPSGGTSCFPLVTIH